MAYFDVLMNRGGQKRIARGGPSRRVIDQSIDKRRRILVQGDQLLEGFPQRIEQEVGVPLARTRIVIAIQKSSLLGHHEASTGARGFQHKRSERD
jgi:hypothetical protein